MHLKLLRHVETLGKACCSPRTRLIPRDSGRSLVNSARTSGGQRLQGSPDYARYISALWGHWMRVACSTLACCTFVHPELPGGLIRLLTGIARQRDRASERELFSFV